MRVLPKPADSLQKKRMIEDRSSSACQAKASQAENDDAESQPTESSHLAFEQFGADQWIQVLVANLLSTDSASNVARKGQSGDHAQRGE